MASADLVNRLHMTKCYTRNSTCAASGFTLFCFKYAAESITQNQPLDRGRLMTALDGLNHRYGRGTVLKASAGLAGDKRAWSMKQERRTPGYTTC